MSAAVLLALTACVNLPGPVRAELQCDPARSNQYGGARACTAPRQRAADPGKGAKPPAPEELPLASGQIILIERPAPMSLYLSLMAERYVPFIHAGIVVMDEGTAYVYEAFGTFGIRVTGSPADDMHGGIRRVTLKSFLRRDGFIAVFEPPPGVDRSSLVEFARHHLARKTPFDGYFDTADAGRYYCVEFVARALEASGGPRVRGSQVTTNRSAGSVLDWLKTAGPELLLAGDLVDTQRPLALVSRRYSREQMAAYFELKKELHRRFTAQQPLGSLFRWRWQNLEYRPLVQAYFNAGLRPGAPDAVTLARQLFDGAQGPALGASR
jgi:Permuted papain-like amidase enzyme, YaeF/YiiX, C92 family